MLAEIVALARPRKPWRLTLTGASMLPNMRDGDELLVEPHCKPGLGDVIVFPHQEKLVAHRIIETGDRFITAGDASRGAREHVPPDAVLGTVTEVRRGGAIVRSHVRSKIAALYLRARLAIKYHLRISA